VHECNRQTDGQNCMASSSTHYAQRHAVKLYVKNSYTIIARFSIKIYSLTYYATHRASHEYRITSLGVTNNMGIVNTTQSHSHTLHQARSVAISKCNRSCHVRLPCPVYERRRLYERTVDTGLCPPLCGLFLPGSSWSIVSVVDVIHKCS